MSAGQTPRHSSAQGRWLEVRRLAGAPRGAVASCCLRGKGSEPGGPGEGSRRLHLGLRSSGGLPPTLEPSTRRRPCLVSCCCQTRFLAPDSLRKSRCGAGLGSVVELGPHTCEALALILAHVRTSKGIMSICKQDFKQRMSVGSKGGIVGLHFELGQVVMTLRKSSALRARAALSQMSVRGGAEASGTFVQEFRAGRGGYLLRCGGRQALVDMDRTSEAPLVSLEIGAFCVWGGGCGRDAGGTSGWVTGGTSGWATDRGGYERRCRGAAMPGARLSSSLLDQRNRGPHPGLASATVPLPAQHTAWPGPVCVSASPVLAPSVWAVISWSR